MVDQDLLNMFKKSIGRLDQGTELDEYYKQQLDAVREDLLDEDIEKSILDSTYGKQVIVYGAVKLMNNEDLATNPTFNLMKNKLSAKTKGDRYDDGNKTGHNS